MKLETLDLLPRGMDERCARRAADLVADLFWNESFEDYGAAVLTRKPDGSIDVRVGVDRNTWLALCIAADRDVALASRIAELDTRDGWQAIECLGGHIMGRTIEDADGQTVAFLFKR